MKIRNLKAIIKTLIFSDYENISLKRKVFILLIFTTLMLAIVGGISDILIGMGTMTRVVNMISLPAATAYYFYVRNSKNYEKGALQFIFLAILFLSFAWFANGGYNGAMLLLIVTYFITFFIITPANKQPYILIASVVIYILLVITSYYFPEIVTHYSNEHQRFLDLLFGGSIFLITLFMIIRVVVQDYIADNKKIHDLSQDLATINRELTTSNQYLKESSEMLSIAMRASNQIWFGYVPETEQMTMGGGFYDMLGYDKGELELTAEDYLKIVHPDDVSILATNVMQAAENKSSFSFEYRVRDKAGNIRWVQTTGEFVEADESGHPGRLLGVYKDVTEDKIAQQSLAESEEKYRALINNTMEGILILDLSGTILFTNQSLADIFHLEHKDMAIGRKVFEFIAPESIPKVMEDFANVVQGVDSYVSEYKSFTVDGKELWVESIGKIITYEGRPVDLVSLRDVTDRKVAEMALEESQARYKNLFDTMPNGFYRTTPDGYFVEANPALINMLGYDSFEDLKKLHIPTELYVQSTERDEMLADNADFVDQIEMYRLRRKDGKVIWLEDNARYVKDEHGNIIFHEGICKDITERKEANAKLQKYAEELASLNATKDKFFSILAHDLRNPLGTFKEMSRVLFDDYDAFDEAERKEVLGSMKDSALQIHDLLENLLMWSRSQRGNINFSPEITNLQLLSQNAINIAALTAQAKQIEISNKVPEGVMVEADAHMVNTVIRNLLANAVKFTPLGGKIEVGALENTNSCTTIYVKDSGVGMSEEQIVNIFKLGRSTSTDGTSGEKGTGLGLVLCKEFVEKHGGRIWLESDLGKGSTFYFTLPKIGDE